VPGEPWRCTSCHKNNVAGAATCATCGRAPVGADPVMQADRRGPTKPKPMTAKERERVVTAKTDEQPVTQPTPSGAGRVRFSGETRKTPRPRMPSTEWRVPLEEPTLHVPEPAGISTAPPPLRYGTAPTTPSYPRRRRDLGWLVKVGLSVVAIVLAWQFGLPWVEGLIAENSAESGASSTGQTTAQPCPPEAADALPGQAGALLVRYQTNKHVITVCQTSDGRVFYDGQFKRQPPGPETHISLPAEVTSDGYIAHNGNYTYRITGDRIVVTKGNTVLLNEVLQPA
jgi:hypothetical protein